MGAVGVQKWPTCRHLAQNPPLPAPPCCVPGNTDMHVNTPLLMCTLWVYVHVCVCDRALDVRAHCVHMCAHVPSPTSVLPSQVAAPTASLSSPTPLSPEASVPLKPP